MPEKNGGPYRLRYYKLDQDKGRVLGHVPFAKATIMEREGGSGPWAFAVAGVDSASKLSQIFAGDVEAIHTRIDDATQPLLAGDALSFQSGSGVKTASMAKLMGVDYQNAIYTPAANATSAYLEFLPDGNSLTISPTGEVDRGRWIKTGDAFQITSAKGAVTRWPEAELHP